MTDEKDKRLTVFEQIKWERDVALKTLEDHGVSLGQKGWTPCSEGLPEVGEQVLITYIGYTDGKLYCSDSAYLDNYGVWCWYLDDSRVMVEVIAWMPTPEPYKVVE